MSDPELFVVRIWRQLASGFRASARRVDSEEVHHFTQPDEVARFLSAAAEPDAGPNDAADRIVPARVNPKE